MRRPGLFEWMLLALWSTWLHALQGHLASVTRWVPDLGMILLVVLAARVPSADLTKAGLAVALGRIAVSIEPPAAVLVGMLVPITVLGSLRSVIVIREGFARAVLAALGSVLLAAWLAFVLEARAAASLASFQPHFEFELWRPALATALVAFLGGPLLTLLPGLSRVIRRRHWEVAASSH